MVYILGFTDYDGAHEYLSEGGFVSDPVFAVWFSSPEKAQAAILLSRRKGSGLRLYTLEPESKKVEVFNG